MKKILLWIILPALTLSLNTGCKKSMEKLYVNPNKPTSVPPALLLNGILNDLYQAPYGNFEKYNQYYIINYDYYGNNRYDFGQGSNYY